MNIEKETQKITHEYYSRPGDVHRSKWPDSSAMDELHPSLDLLTLCVLVLDDGSTVVGEHRAVKEGLDVGSSCQAARAHAVQKITAS